MSSFPLCSPAPVVIGAAKAPLRRPVVVAGYVALDVIFDQASGGYWHSAGGTAGNVAAALAWLGVPTALVARLGSDATGSAVRDDLVACGVDASHVQLLDDMRSPAVAHLIARGGAHRFRFTCPACGRTFPRHRPPTRDQLVDLEIDRRSIFFFDRASSAAIELASRVRDAGGLVVFEPNGPGRTSATTRAVELASVLKVSEQRVDSVFARMPRVSGQVQVLTMGARGLRWRLGPGKWRIERATRAPALLDSAGAGDWTTAGFLAQLSGSGGMEESEVASALQFGQALGALSVGYVGARGLSRATGPLEAQARARALLSGLSGLNPVAVPGERTSEVRGASCPVCLDVAAS